MIFPEFENGQIIDRIREQYDPLAQHVRPHITLVFPFDSDIETKELEEHISKVISGFTPFEVVLNGITPANSFGKHLFLNIQKGHDEIVELHKRLYTGILKKYFPVWLQNGIFKPHMTVGNFDKESDFELGINETRNINDSFKTIINEISVEIIDENEDSIIELCVPIE